MSAANKSVFDIIAEQFIYGRVDDIMMQDTEYIKLQDELWKEKERFDKLSLSEAHHSVMEKLVSLYIRVIELYGKKAYGQGFKDCVSMLQEIGVIKGF